MLPGKPFDIANSYLRFNYFGSDDPSWYYINICNPEKYGVTEFEVSKYRLQMETDRENWHRKENDLEVYGVILHILFSLFIIPVVYILIMGEFILVFEDIELVNSTFIKYIVESLFLLSIILLIGIEYYLWKTEIIIFLYKKLIERFYMKKSQNNALIEKLFEDAHFEEWKDRNKQRLELRRLKLLSNQ